MAAQGVTTGDPRKLSKSGGTMAGPLILEDDSPAASEAYVGAHGGGGGGSSVVSVNGVEPDGDGDITLTAADVDAVGLAGDQTIDGNLAAENLSGTNTGDQNLTPYLRKDDNLDSVTDPATARGNLALGTGATHDVAASGDASATELVLGNDSRLGGGGGASITVVDNGFTTSGNITATSGAWTQLGTDIVMPAAAGDHLEIQVEALGDSAANFITVDVATQTGSGDTNWASTGTASSRYPGSIPPWTLPAANFFGVTGPVGYVVQAGDVVSGDVTLRCYARTDAGSRAILATATFPFRWRVINYGH